MLAFLIWTLILGFVLNTDASVQDFYWRNYIPGDIPYDAFEGATGVYIGQVHWYGDLPASIYPHNKAAITQYKTKAIVRAYNKILCTTEPHRFYWEYVDFNKMGDHYMKNVVHGGFLSSFDRPVFIGKAHHEGQWKISRAHPIDDPEKGLYIWDKDGEMVRLMEFYLLKYNSTVIGKDGAVVQDFYWRYYIPGDIPYDAFEGAPGRYVGQVHHNGYSPATIYPHLKIAVFELNNEKKTISQEIKILCSPDNTRFYWEFVSFNKAYEEQMENAIEAGIQSDIWSDVFIGKVNHEGEWKIGRVVPIDRTSHKGLYVWDKNDKEFTVLDFYILKFNTTIVNSDVCKCE